MKDMPSYKIAIIPGDGIGPELTKATVQILETVQERYNINLALVNADAGDACFERKGVALPEETINLIKTSDACLKGLVGETAADVIVRLRILFDLYANIRPIRVYPNIPCLRPDIDMVIVRENTEGVYRGIEFDVNDDTAICLRIITRKASARIARYAFNVAKNRRKDMRVTAVHKANVMKKTDGIFSQTCRVVAKEYPEIHLDELYVDNAAMQLIKRPQEFDVLVTTNMFGDILSDEASILVGGLGVAPGANIGDDFALFEPVHGSAPKYASKNVANPTSMILASKLMLEWLGEKYSDRNSKKAAVAIEKALIETFKANVLTQDLGGSVKTDKFGQAVADRIE
jgi:3-isopropylmalate dehydrogenase